MLIILSPLFILISLLSLLFQGYPIVFKQKRIGYSYRPFTLYKFRSMNNTKTGSKITKSKDSRITKWGKFVRTFKLDEIPQLWNIAKREMRFVGPRPEDPDYIEGNDFTFLEKIKPGLTDLASILLRNESEVLSRKGGVEKYPQLLEVKVALGHLYAEHKCFWLDLRLVFVTIVSIIFPKTAIIIIKHFFIRKYKPDLISAISEWID